MQGTRGNVIVISDIPKRSSYIIIDLSVTGGHQFEFRVFDRSNQSIRDVRGGHAAAAHPPTALAIDSVFELAFLLDAVEVAFRFCDESVIVDLPKFVAAD